MNYVLSSKVKGLSLPWDIKVTPLSISTADMDVSKDTVDTGNLDNTEIELEVDMETDIETTVQASMETVSKTIMLTSVEMSETTTQESLEAEIVTQSQGGLEVEVTPKTSMETNKDGMEPEEIEVNWAGEETTPRSGTESSSFTNIGASLDALVERGEGAEEEKVVETSKPHTLKPSLEVIKEIGEHGEEGTRHQIDVNTEPPQAVSRRTIYQYLLHHHDNHHTKTQQHHQYDPLDQYGHQL